MSDITIPTVEETKKLWDDFSEGYAATLEPLTFIIDSELQYMAQLPRAKKAVIVPGAGPGMGALRVKQNIPKDIKLYVGDISGEMVKITKHRFKEAGFDSEDPATNSVIGVMDNQELPIETAAADLYISNLSWMLVPDPKLQAQEAFRVLEEGGVALFSVWGRPEFSNFHTIPFQLMKEFEVPLPPKRSNFHLGVDDVAKNLLLESGFKNVMSWNTTVPCAVFDADLYLKSLESIASWQKAFAFLGDKAETFKARIKEECQKVLDSGKPLTFDSLVLLARK
mmetsp:Transcript_48847/g.56143  ORF Transcript_48847/g.56143 Transcript_48847/m.56143 type:complete len:281 (-) Transcript_48847:127-969(-)